MTKRTVTDGSLPRRCFAGQPDGRTAGRLPRGFSLIETLIAMTVLAVLASVVIMASRSTGSEMLEASARVLASDLRLARNLAIQYDTEWTVRLDLENNAYELVHTGAGDPPPPPNPLAAPGNEDRYLVELDRLGASLGNGGSAQLAGAVLQKSRQNVSGVTFGPLGGTGPVRSEDTIIRLREGRGPKARWLDVRVSWVTGQVWTGRPTMRTGTRTTRSNP